MNTRLFGIIILILFFAGGYIMFGRQTTTPKSTQTQISRSPAQTTQKTVTDDCTGAPTPSQTEGPYYKAGSPERKDIAVDLAGEKLTVTGYVFDKNCKPIANTWLDFWQADSKGVYDNVGYTLRGHQFTDEYGKYSLMTIIPAAYESRPPHIHVKIRVDNETVLTTQLYFPNTSQNQTDSIFNEALVMNVSDKENGKAGTFSFILNQ